jgi:hypothetical protein
VTERRSASVVGKPSKTAMEPCDRWVTALVVAASLRSSRSDRPQSKRRRPWVVGHNSLRDALGHRFACDEESIVFGRVPLEQARSA